HAPPGIDPEVLLHCSEDRKGRGFPSRRGPAALRGRRGHQQGGEAAQAGNGNQGQKAAAIPLGRLPPKVQTEDHRECRVPIVACRNAERVRDGVPIRLGRQMIEARCRGIRLWCTRRGVHAALSLVLLRARRADEDHIAVTPHVLRQTCLRQRAATTGVYDSREASGHQRTATSGTTSHPTRRRARMRGMWWQERPRLYCSTNPSYPLAATSARLARMTGALSGLPSKNRALPGMFAPTNQEFALVRSKPAPASTTCARQASSASGVASMRVKPCSRIEPRHSLTHSTSGSQPRVKLPAPAPGMRKRFGKPALWRPIDRRGPSASLSCNGCPPVPRISIRVNAPVTAS